MRKIVAGVDSSTQSVKVVLRDATTGELIAQSSRPHPEGTEVDPQEWKKALDSALGELSQRRIEAISIAGQQHGMVALDQAGEVIRKALLWNDTRSSVEAEEINKQFPDIHHRTGSRLVASFTASKVRWLSKHEPNNARRVATIALPHDWLSWQLMSDNKIGSLFTDRSDASGTGYFDPKKNEYCGDIFSYVLNSENSISLPRIAKPGEIAAETNSGIPLACGAGDNAAAALGVGARVGDLVISLGTSGTAFAVSAIGTHDSSGEVAGFADATGNFLPLACTLNAAKVFASVARSLALTWEEFSEVAMQAKPGCDGLRLLPHFDGERTPNRPNARGSFAGITHSNFTRENIARSAIEGVIAGMIYAWKSVEKQGVSKKRVLLIGGAARNPAVQQIAASMLGTDIHVPAPGEYVADGAAKQAAWALLGSSAAPEWELGVSKIVTPTAAEQSSELVASYLDLIASI